MDCVAVIVLDRELWDTKQDEETSAAGEMAGRRVADLTRSKIEGAVIIPVAEESERCPVCYEEPVEGAREFVQIHANSEGQTPHKVCSACYRLLTNCPICRAPIPGRQGGMAVADPAVEAQARSRECARLFLLGMCLGSGGAMAGFAGTSDDGVFQGIVGAGAAFFGIVGLCGTIGLCMTRSRRGAPPA